MIIFETVAHQIDLTHLKPSLVEESNWFVNDSLKNYSLPFDIYFTDDVAHKLGLANIENVHDYPTVINGQLIIDDDFYNAYIKLGKIQGNRQQATLIYGPNVLDLFYKNLNELGWPTIITTSLTDHASSIIDTPFPDTSHNFPRIFRPSIKEQADYTDFENFINNMSGTSFIENSTTSDAEGTYFHNKNVMMPSVYLLEILRFGYATENKICKGELFNSDFWTKVVYIPETFFERFYSNQYDAFSFNLPTSFTYINNTEMGVYERIYTPTTLGTYKIKFTLNLPTSLAIYFSLKITIRDTNSQAITEVYSRVTYNNPVNLNKELDINITSDSLYDQIKIELIIPKQVFSIIENNAFEYYYTEGRLNTFPTSFSLADFMPDMTFGEFENTIKNWLNLAKREDDNIVYFDFIDTKIQNLQMINNAHLQDPDASFDVNTNRYFKLKDQSGDTVNVVSTGQILSNPEEHNNVIDMDMNVTPAKVDINYSIITAIFNEDTSGLRFGIYDGLLNNKNVCIDRFNDQDLSLQTIYETYWKNWLQFRTTSKTVSEKFKASIYDGIHFNKGLFKYNEVLLLKKRTKKVDSENTYIITAESETF